MTGHGRHGAPLRVLIWMELVGIGGSERFMIDLAERLDAARFHLILASNPFPPIDAALARSHVSLGGRIKVGVATNQSSASLRLWRRMRRHRRGMAPTIRSTEDPPGAEVPAGAGTLMRHAAVAALRYGNLAANHHRLREVMVRARPDVVHVNNGGYPGGASCTAAVLAAASAGRLPVIHYTHNLALPRLWPEPLEARLDRKLDSAIRNWVTPARQVGDLLVSRRGIAPDRVRTVHLGVPSASVARADERAALRRRFDIDEGTPALVCVGSLEPRKGQHVLLDALAALGRAAPRPTALFVGDGPDRAALEAHSARLGLSGHVRFLGWREDVHDLLSASDMLVLASTGQEALPYAVLEAMSHGLPVIATDVGGVREMLRHDETGVVIPPGSADALAKAIEWLCQSGRDRSRLGQNARKHQQKAFSVDRMTAEMAAMYEAAAATRPAATSPR